MPHMQHDITPKQSGFEVETLSGTFYIPGDVAPVPVWLAYDVNVTPEQSAIFEYLESLVSDYVEARQIQHITAIKDHYFCRLSAPGYLDCTDWCAFKSLRACREYLSEI